MAHSGKTITFATDLLPQEDNVYSLGDNGQKWKIYGEIQPIATKTYTTALYNSSSGANFYQTFATVTPADYNAIWIAHYRITITASGHSDYTEICDVSISGRSDTYYSYKIYNSLVTYPIYYHVLLNGSSASYPHELGYRMASSYGATDVQKTVKVELLEQINCTITLLDNLKLYTSAVPTNYTAWRAFNATSNGLQETGDNNDTAYYILSNGFKGKAGSNKVYRYCLFARTSDGSYESFVMEDNTVATTKTVNPHGFVPDGKIYWNSNNTTYSQGTLNISAYEQYHVIDYRYSFNFNNTFLPDYCETYIVWTYNATDGLLYLDTTQWLAAALPTTADGKIYQRIGSKYYTGTSNYYQGSLLLDNPYYEYRNGALHEWHGNAASIPQVGNAEDKTYPILFKNTNNTTDEIASIKYSNNVSDTVTTTKPFTYNPSTGLLTASKIQIGIKDDTYGFLPYANNWNSLGANNLYWYRVYATNHYGTTSYITNWTSNNNIGTAATASAAATLGKVNFYNTCAANGTQTKTTLIADSTANSNITITLPKSTGTLALVGDNSHTHDYLPLSGGQMTGSLTWKDGTALPAATSISYLLGIDAFASGGTTKYITVANAWTSLGGGASGTHADSYFIKAITSTDNAIVRFDSTAGQVQNSGVTIDDNNNILTKGNLTLNSASGNSPALLFTRDSTLTDWKILVTSGKLSFQSAADASAWTERASFADNSGNFTVTGTMTATKFIGPLQGNADTATSANALNFVHTNEILIGNTNAQAGIHINHRRVLNGATSGNTAITDYYFKNGNGAVTGVTIHAASFDGSCTGNAASATQLKINSKTDKKLYLLGTQTSPPNSATAVTVESDSGVYVTTTAGQLSATSYSINYSSAEKVKLQWNNTDSSLDFIFV